jgi:hypothetical protein
MNAVWNMLQTLAGQGYERKYPAWSPEDEVLDVDISAKDF